MRLAALLTLGALPLLAAASAPTATPKFGLPIDCVVGKTCAVQNYVDRDPSAGVLDYHCGHRTYEHHTGTDIRLTTVAAQKAGVDVLAGAAGRVLRTRDGVPDISIRAPGAPPLDGKNCGNAVVIDHGDGWISAYCHMARGSVRVKPGDTVAAGQPIGRVGMSGDTEFPHVHFQVAHGGEIVDPFAPAPVAPGACPAQGSLWTDAAARALAYRRGVVLNAGFAQAVPTQDEIDAGGLPAPSATGPAVVAYVRAINLEAGDVIEMTLAGPDGKVLAATRSPPLDHDKAVWLAGLGRKRPLARWPPGRYTALYRVLRGGQTALTQRLAVDL